MIIKKCNICGEILDNDKHYNHLYFNGYCYKDFDFCNECYKTYGEFRTTLENEYQKDYKELNNKYDEKIQKYFEEKGVNVEWKKVK